MHEELPSQSIVLSKTPSPMYNESEMRDTCTKGSRLLFKHAHSEAPKNIGKASIGPNRSLSACAATRAEHLPFIWHLMRQQRLVAGRICRRRRRPSRRITRRCSSRIIRICRWRGINGGRSCALLNLVLLILLLLRCRRYEAARTLCTSACCRCRWNE